MELWKLQGLYEWKFLSEILTLPLTLPANFTGLSPHSSSAARSMPGVSTAEKKGEGGCRT